MAKKSVTPAMRQLDQAKVEYKVHQYQYVDKGGAGHASESLGVDPHQMIKTIVMTDDSGQTMFVLMHGDREISTKQLARELGVKKISPVSPAKVTQLTGYKVGGTSPFGSRTRLPVYIERALLDFSMLFINGGSRGLILEIPTTILLELLNAKSVQVAIEPTH